MFFLLLYWCFYLTWDLNTFTTTVELSVFVLVLFVSNFEVSQLERYPKFNITISSCPNLVIDNIIVDKLFSTFKHAPCEWMKYTWMLNMCSCRIFWLVVKRPSACPHTLGSYWSASAPHPCRSPAFWAPALETPALAFQRRSRPRFPPQDPTLTSTPSTAHFLQSGL